MDVEVDRRLPGELVERWLGNVAVVLEVPALGERLRSEGQKDDEADRGL